jgi:hypothetical protein
MIIGRAVSFALTALSVVQQQQQQQQQMLQRRLGGSLLLAQAPRRTTRLLATTASGGADDEPAASVLRSNLASVGARVDALLKNKEMIPSLKLRISDLELLSAGPQFWDNQQEAQRVMEQIAQCNSRISRFDMWTSRRKDAVRFFLKRKQQEPTE